MPQQPKNVGTIISVTSGAALKSGQASAFAYSYPDDIDSALAIAETTMTGNGDREKAFKRAGLR